MPDGGPSGTTVPSTLLDPASEVGKKCHSIVEQVRDGKLRVAEAFRQIGEELPYELSDDERNAAMDSYFRILSKHELSRDAAAKRARPVPGTGGDKDPEPAEEDEPEPKRARGSLEDFLASAPWVVQQELSGKKLNASLEATANIIFHATRNLSQVKASLIGPGKPPFPDSEWTAMLQGRSVNFDNVLSNLYGSLGDEKHTQLNSELELVQKGASSSATRKVATFGEWHAAFNPYRNAVEYIFPHRSRELREYGRYIDGLFIALGDSPATHRRVVDFDKAIRTLVATRGDIELTDFTDLEYRRIEIQYIHGSGVGSGSGASSSNTTSKSKPSKSSKPGQSSTEPCRRFNRDEPHPADSCRYKHVCESCGAVGVPATKCKCSAAKRA
ncbi:hypothetical protein EXIGLDRAFT_758334 [Exidia glandulosa HHB12029]|uniref:C3H1-type domain-containing protein n=1 Tax=Exidia glandulosa HHB12029 TaxID=1314781 RepID=A0A165QSX0_EXIGL|nr:hypothetical protein EXIGLDRAFT_758334 [Exidia glandulosa HHB12029]